MTIEELKLILDAIYLSTRCGDETVTLLRARAIVLRELKKLEDAM